ncbi:thiamine-phosphate kinase [Caulobacter sp. KR2-114]|uniref:thiamine-phosphate kinase n=1 Tax=Caulobacter sp. KR2-114 TaxID=3400912 RepID=UPI003C021F4E
MSRSPSRSSTAPNRASSTARWTPSPAMSGGDAGGAGPGGGEFAEIARLYRPLTRGAPEALALLDDAAVLPSRPGFDLVLTADALVEGVHFLPDDPLDSVARKLLRVNLSDLAAKGAEPYGYLLTTAWSPRCGPAERAVFARGLEMDGAAFDLVLLGGDTVSTPGPLTLAATLLGWVPAGALVRRGGARAGDRLLVSGQIGKGWLGLAARQGRLADPDGAFSDFYRLPQPRLALAPALRAHASAAADVSDGLVADAGHLAKASGLSLTLALDAIPLHPAIVRADRLAAATGGDDYEVVCAAPPEAVAALIDAARAAGVPLSEIGAFAEGEGVIVTDGGQTVDVQAAGWRHF